MQSNEPCNAAEGVCAYLQEMVVLCQTFGRVCNLAHPAYSYTTLLSTFAAKPASAIALPAPPAISCLSPPWLCT